MLVAKVQGDPIVATVQMSFVVPEDVGPLSQAAFEGFVLFDAHPHLEFASHPQAYATALSASAGQVVVGRVHDVPDDSEVVSEVRACLLDADADHVIASSSFVGKASGMLYDGMIHVKVGDAVRELRFPSVEGDPGLDAASLRTAGFPEEEIVAVASRFFDRSPVPTP